MVLWFVVEFDVGNKQQIKQDSSTIYKERMERNIDTFIFENLFYWIINVSSQYNLNSLFITLFKFILIYLCILISTLFSSSIVMQLEYIKISRLILNKDRTL